MWALNSFSSYLVLYYVKYIPGDYFLNNALNGIAASASLISAMLAMKYCSMKVALLLFYGVSFVCGGLLLALGETSGILIPLCVLGCKFGASGNFTNHYYVNVSLFPVYVASTVFGVTNIGARTATVFAPTVAEVQAPIPMILYCLFALIGIVLTFTLRQGQDASEGKGND